MIFVGLFYLWRTFSIFGLIRVSHFGFLLDLPWSQYNIILIGASVEECVTEGVSYIKTTLYLPGELENRPDPFPG